MESEFKRKKIDLSKLDNSLIIAQVLEIIATKKCNLACSHCMRGDAKGEEITKDVYDAIFKKIKIIENLNIGGGEPSISPNTLVDLLQSLKENKVIINNFALTTNGVYVDDAFLDALANVKNYVEECTKKNISVFEKNPHSNFYLVISTDDFHLNEMIKKGYTLENLLKNIKTYREVFGDDCVEFKGFCDFEVINEGRATNIPATAEIKKYIQKPLSSKFGLTELRDDLYFITGILTISTTGKVLPCCNLSFENENVFSAGNIQKQSLSEILGNINLKTIDRKQVNQFISKIYRDISVNKRDYKRYTKTKGLNKETFLWTNSQPEK